MSSRAAPTRAKFAAGESVLILGATGVAGRLGAAIPLAAATLRGSGLEPLDSGFGSNSLDDVNQAVSEMVAEAAKNPFERGESGSAARDRFRVELASGRHAPGVCAVTGEFT